MVEECLSHKKVLLTQILFELQSSDSYPPQNTFKERCTRRTLMDQS